MKPKLRVYSRAAKVCTGYVVKREYFEEDKTTKKMVKHRKEIGRVFHAKSAAEDLLTMLKKQNPDWTLYIHEKMKADGLSHIPT